MAVRKTVLLFFRHGQALNLQTSRPLVDHVLADGVVENRTVEADVFFADAAVSAFAEAAAHLALLGDPDVFFLEAFLEKTHDREAHHGRRTDDDSLCLFDVADGHFGDEFGDKADVAFVAFGGAVDGEDEVKSVRPVFEVASEQHVVGALEADDDVFVLCVLCQGEGLDDAADGGYACAAGDDDDFTVLIEGDVESVAVGAAHEQALAFVFFKDFTGDASDLSDGEVDEVLADAADGDGCFAVFGHGDFKELAGLDIADKLHAESVLFLCVSDHFQDLGGKRHVGVILHVHGYICCSHYFTSFAAASSCTALLTLLMQAEKEMYSGQMASQRPQPTHI